MKKLSCECCGAALPVPDRYQRYVKCPYCDATYEVEHWESRPAKQPLDYTPIPEVRYILVEPGHIKKYGASISINEEAIRHYPPEILEKYVKDQLAQQIADFIKNELTIYEDYDIKNFERRYMAYIRLDTRGNK